MNIEQDIKNIEKKLSGIAGISNAEFTDFVRKEEGADPDLMNYPYWTNSIDREVRLRTLWLLDVLSRNPNLKVVESPRGKRLVCRGEDRYGHKIVRLVE